VFVFRVAVAVFFKIKNFLKIKNVIFLYILHSHPALSLLSEGVSGGGERVAWAWAWV
jgi:hypothetical protein